MSKMLLGQLASARDRKAVRLGLAVITIAVLVRVALMPAFAWAWALERDLRSERTLAARERTLVERGPAERVWVDRTMQALDSLVGRRLIVASAQQSAQINLARWAHAVINESGLESVQVTVMPSSADMVPWRPRIVIETISSFDEAYSLVHAIESGDLLVVVEQLELALTRSVLDPNTTRVAEEEAADIRVRIVIAAPTLLVRTEGELGTR